MANCTHLGLINPTVRPSGEGCKECLEIGGHMGPSAGVRSLRTRGLLRLFAQQARHQAFSPDQAPYHTLV